MAYLAEFAAAAALAAAALVPTAALVRAASANAAETKCYMVANGLTKAIYESAHDRILVERGASGVGQAAPTTPMTFGGITWGGRGFTRLNEELQFHCVGVLADLSLADQNAVVAVASGSPREILLPGFLVLIEFAHIDDDTATAKYSTIKMKKGLIQAPTLNKTDNVYSDFTILKSVVQTWKRTPDGRFTFTRPHTLTTTGVIEPQ